MAGTILFVCTGNTCRSPMAEGIARELLGTVFSPAEARQWMVRSAGTATEAGRSPTPEAIRAARRLGADITRHRSEPLERELIEWARIIYAMSRSHLEIAKAMCPTSLDRLHLLDPDADIEDPIGQGQEAYDTTAARIRGLVEARLKELKELR